jgi:hypothetical protein
MMSLIDEALNRVTRRRDSVLRFKGEMEVSHLFTFLAKMDEFRFEVPLQERSVLISLDAPKVF